MEMEKINQVLDKIVDYLSIYGIKLVGAIIALIIGLWIIKLIMKGIKKGFDKKIDNPSLSRFLSAFISVTLKIMLIFSIMSMIGIKMTSFIAVLGAAGLAVGMALSGTLQNFAGGVMVLIFKPFKVGDFIQAMGQSGTVKEIQIFNTILNTPDNRIIIIPNGKIYSETITNFSMESQRRVDFVFGIGYDSDLDKAKEIILEVVSKNEKILKDPAPFIALGEMGDSSVNLTTRVWVDAPNYWDVFFGTNEQVYKAFNAEGINIPYPQMDVHISNQQ